MGLMACWRWSRRFGGCGMRGLTGSAGVIVALADAVVPPWEAFPETNRDAVRRLLGLLVERMTVLPTPASGRCGNERDECRG